MQISKRLEMVASLVTSGLKVADIGTDHGYIPIYLAMEGRVPHGIAMDVNQGPLQKAVENISLYGLSERIETRLSDGLTALIPGEADCIVIAGMGGPLTIRILKEGADCVRASRELILQPQSEIRLVRTFLMEQGWRIIREEIVLEDGKFYPMMKAVPADGPEEIHISPEGLRFGPLLLERLDPVLYQYLQKELKTQQKILKSLSGQPGEAACARKREVEEELTWTKSALNRFDVWQK